MKSEKQIEKEIEVLESRLSESKTKHSQLNQIDVLSCDGSDLRSCVAKIEGKIEVLRWVIS